MVWLQDADKFDDMFTPFNTIRDRADSHRTTA